MHVENRNFWINLGKIQNALLLSDLEFAEYLGVSYLHFNKQKKTSSFLPLNCVFECAEKLNFHFEDLLQENFSTKSILGKIQGNYSLQEKYSTATYSKTRHLANVLKYLEKTRGEREKINFLRKFQLTENFINCASNNVNILLATDIMNYLAHTYQFSDSEFLKIGQMTPFTNMNTDVKEAIVTKKNIYETLEYFFDELSSRFDKNCTYRIENMNSDNAIIEAKSNKHVIEELAIPHTQFGSEPVCHTRMGLMSSVTWFKYNRFVPIKKISSIYKGDATNYYLMDISSFKYLSSTPNLSLLNNTIYH